LKPFGRGGRPTSYLSHEFPMRRLVILAASALLPATLSAQTPADRDAVKQAALDYIEGFYEGDSTRFIRSIRPEVYKYGFYRDTTGSYRGMQMQWQGFHNFANRVKRGQTRTPANAPKQVEVLDVADQVAAAKVTAYWGIDYLLLGKYDGKWMISHVTWQSPPRK
jgi:hypothetical protein